MEAEEEKLYFHAQALSKPELNWEVVFLVGRLKINTEEA